MAYLARRKAILGLNAGIAPGHKPDLNLASAIPGNSLVLRQGSRGSAAPYFGTRREYVPVGSVATSMSLKVPKQGAAPPLLRA